MKTIDCEQYSEPWWEARRGVPTASNFKRIITPATGKLSAQADDYICELIAEKYHIGAMDELSGPATAAMRNGTETEPEARRWYCLEQDDVREVGFIMTDCGRFGCSPDGLVGENGGLELKCPVGKTHIRYLLDGHLPDEYKAQVHGSLIVSGRAWWDFLSYVPGLPPFKIRVEPDDFTDKLRAALEVFWQKYQDTIAALDIPAPEREVFTDADHPF